MPKTDEELRETIETLRAALALVHPYKAHLHPADVARIVDQTLKETELQEGE